MAYKYEDKKLTQTKRNIKGKENKNKKKDI